MELTLTRRWKTTDALMGEIAIGGVRECYTLENRALAIVPGRYRILLTPSMRAAQGTLWSPRADHVLPLIDGVPGRDGIRIHAGNTSHDVIGCVLVGTKRDDDAVEGSRVELIALMAKLGAATDDIWITVQDAAA